MRVNIISKDPNFRFIIKLKNPYIEKRITLYELTKCGISTIN